MLQSILCVNFGGKMVIKRFSTFFIATVCTLFLAGCVKKQTVTIKENTRSNVNKQKTDKAPIVTVWVHGTRLLVNKLANKLTPQELFYSPPGMIPIKDVPAHYHMYHMAEGLSQKDPQRFQMDNFYLFGWNGKLSFKERKLAAQHLYNELVNLTKEYQKQYNVTPTFRIITHSHGGNVALNLAKVKKDDVPFEISELILLACPVQEKTKNFVADPLFKRVYSLFSRGELLQVMDPQGIYKGHSLLPLFSQRTFPNNPKLSQAKIRMYGRSILHIEFLLGHFVLRLPEILDALDKHSKNDDYVIIDLKKKRTQKHQSKEAKKIVLI